METSFQKIIAALVGVMIMFIIPVYIAFEKADDISYSLAVKLTQNFIDNARNKGYISPDMYSDFVSGLYSTNNTYDVEIEHVKKRYDPVIYVYEKTDDDKKGRLLHVLDYDRYRTDFEANSITIDVGIYNLTNADVNIDEPSITFADGSQIIKPDGTAYPEADLYKDKIDQYKATGKIVIDKGEIYADVTKVLGASFDDDVYNPALIDDSFKGKIQIINKQGNEGDFLPYEEYKNAYYGAAGSVVFGPTYNFSEVKYFPASMKLIGKSATEEEAEEMYYDLINEYRIQESSGDGRIIIDKGEIYADRPVVISKHGVFDDRIDINSQIKLVPGEIKIKPGSVVSGYESDLSDYDTFIEKYRSGQQMIEEGEVYTVENSDIEDIRAAIWKDGTVLNQEEAENLYYDQIENYEDHGKVVLDKGEIYSTSVSAIGYNPLTDEIRNLEMVGSINVDSIGWEPNTLDFNEYIEEYRATNKIEYLAAGTYKAQRTQGKLTVGTGSNKVEFDYNTYEDAMLDESDTITVNVKYGKYDIDFNEDFRIIVRNKETGAVIRTGTRSSISSIRTMILNNEVGLSGMWYEGNIIFAGKEYTAPESSEYEIVIESPEIIFLESELPSTVQLKAGIDNLDPYLQEYIENEYMTYSKEYAKESMTFKRESLKLEIDSDTDLILYRNLNKSEYDEYIDGAQTTSTGRVKKVTVNAITIPASRLNVEYSQINVEGKDPINITSANYHLVNQYYNNNRIVVREASILEETEVNITYPSLTIYEKGTSNVLYMFRERVGSERDKYLEYSNEFRTKGSVTIIPTRTYNIDDVTVIPAKIQITYYGEAGTEEIKEIPDTDPNYENYLAQFNATGKIKFEDPIVYNIYSDLEVQHPHIQLKKGSVVEIDIYEEDKPALFAEYKNQYLNTNKVTLKYNKSDWDVKRANITIKKLESKDPAASVLGTIVVEDDDSNYNSYLNEYETTGLITFEGATQYTADQLKVVEPVITIRDPDTGSIILKYEGDYSEIDPALRYQIYEDRVDEWNDNYQFVNEKKTYVGGDNCYFEKAHIVNEEVITDKQIVAKLFENTGVSKLEFLRQCMLGNADMYNSLEYLDENSYVMNEGDKINVTVKNKNQTIASVFYSTFTANVHGEEIARIYVDYGGTVKNDGSTTFVESASLITTSTGKLFTYTGSPEEVILPAGEYYIECFGASGGYPSGADVTKVGKGAYAKARFKTTEDTTVYVYVGGKGTEYSDTNQNNGGYNGGGDAYDAFGGGGATDVRLLKAGEENKASMLTRIIVAAGGGGSSGYELEGYGGSGGNLAQGKDGSPSTSLYEGKGAISSSLRVGYDTFLNTDYSPALEQSIHSREKGDFGIGGSVTFGGMNLIGTNWIRKGAGAGGAGYFGGSAAHDVEAGGGGGLSYIYSGQAAMKDDGVTYPISSIVLNEYEEDEDILNEISPYIQSGKWRGIEHVSGHDEVKTGEEEMPNPLTFTGTDTMTGNNGNGFAIIRKAD